MAGQDRTATRPLNGAAVQSPDALEAALRSAGGDDAPAPRPRMSERPIDHESREAVWDALNTEPWGMDFYALVRRIEALYHDSPGFARSSRASEDPVRFAQEPSLAFPPSHISQYQFARGNAPSRMFVNFMGMLGPMGPLPLHLTEHAHQRELHSKDRTLSRFLDIFNHRMVSLLYRAWSASQLPASHDRAGPQIDGTMLSDAQRARVLATDEDRYAVYVGSLFGLGMDDMRYRDAVPDAAKLHFAGRLSGSSRGPEGLRAILQSYFGVSVHIEEFAGRWLELPKQYWCRLGDNSSSSQLGTRSGGMSVAGSRVWDCQSMFRMRLGPMSLKDYERLLPITASERRLDAWIRNYVGDEFFWEVVLGIKANEVPRARLGAGARLGWTSWVMSGESPVDRDDLVIRSPR